MSKVGNRDSHRDCCHLYDEVNNEVEAAAVSS